jgi:ferric-dicitrate binding protein FerR (iron transport regulator)
MKNIFGNDKKILKKFRNAVFNKLPATERKTLWRRIEASIGQTSVAKRIAIPASYFRIAASIILILTIGYLAKHTLSNPAVDNIKLLTFKTQNEERLQLLLPDSSLVWLNAGSRIEYPERFDSETRNVKLSGEAYFSVHPEKERKFTVQTDHIKVNVIGTRFTVIDYPEEKTAEAILVSGKVNIGLLGLNNPEVNLSPNQQFVFDKTNSNISINQVEASMYTNWINGRLNFDNENLADIITDLEHWFGTKFVYTEELGASYHLTFTIRNENLQQTLQMMESIAPLKFKQSKGKIEIGKMK